MEGSRYFHLRRINRGGPEWARLYRSGDDAIAEDEAENLDLFTQTEAARKAVDHARKLGLLTTGAT